MASGAGFVARSLRFWHVFDHFPDFVGSLGYVYKGSFNTIIVIASISMRHCRPRLGRRGRVPLMLIGGALLAVGMFGLSVAGQGDGRCLG